MLFIVGPTSVNVNEFSAMPVDLGSELMTVASSYPFKALEPTNSVPSSVDHAGVSVFGEECGPVRANGGEVP
jgi:hypothetical protein